MKVKADGPSWKRMVGEVSGKKEANHSGSKGQAKNLGSFYARRETFRWFYAG